MLLPLAACGGRAGPDVILSAPELSALATDRTLYVPPCCDTPNGMMLYLARDGTGWFDSRMLPGNAPSPGGMSMVLSWRATPEAGLCLWATPRIGEMPSLLPAWHECLLVSRSAAPPERLQVAVRHGDRTRTVPLYVYAYNAFPQSTVDRYLTQVRALFGGRLPSWNEGGPLAADDGVPWPVN